MEANTLHSSQIILEPADNQRLACLCGPLDSHLRHIERQIGVEIHNRGNQFQVRGTLNSIDRAKNIIHQLYSSSVEETVSTEQMFALLHQFCNPASNSTSEVKKVVLKKLTIQGRSLTQRHYLNALVNYDINFGIGPAGTGKTYLAVAAAVSALESGMVDRLILTRPAVEAGEKLGFLPGAMEEKIDPYLRPLYDALYEMLGNKKITKYIEQNLIEIAPLAFMRGRTLANSYILLDEAQNTTEEQMKMFLTRIGPGAKVIITGDITQVDLPSGKRSGLKQAMEILKDEEAIHFTFLKTEDIIRHTLIAKIIAAYRHYETQQNAAPKS